MERKSGSEAGRSVTTAYVILKRRVPWLCEFIVFGVLEILFAIIVFSAPSSYWAPFSLAKLPVSFTILLSNGATSLLVPDRLQTASIFLSIHAESIIAVLHGF